MAVSQRVDRANEKDRRRAAPRPLPGGRGDRTWVRPTVSTTGVTSYLTLAEVARRTGRHHEQLRQWCASGRLPCERFGRDWLLLESDLEIVNRAPARRRPRADGNRTVVGVSFTDSRIGRRVLAEASRRFGLDGRDGALAPLAIDDLTLVLVAAIVSDEQLAEAIALFEGHGGTIVANVPEGDRAKPPVDSSPPDSGGAGGAPRGTKNGRLQGTGARL
jgi:excisionase family DNA binding protein